MATAILGLENEFEDQTTIEDGWLNAVADELEMAVTRFAELFGTGVLGSSALNLSIVVGAISLEISSGYAIVGDAGERRLVQIEGPILITTAQGIAASNTYYVFLLREPTDPDDDATYFTANTSGTAPADSILIGKAVFNGTEATSVDQLPQGRINLRNPIVLSGLAADRPTFGVVGRFYFETDTNGGTFWFDTGTAWSQAAPGGSETHVIATTTAIGPKHTVSGLTAGQGLVAISATDVAFKGPGVYAQLVGTFAARPAANSVLDGTYYLATDKFGGTTYRSNGTSWVQIGAGVESDIAAIASLAAEDLIKRNSGNTAFERLATASGSDKVLGNLAGVPTWRTRSKGISYPRWIGTSFERWYGPNLTGVAANVGQTPATDTLFALPYLCERGETFDRIALNLSSVGGAGSKTRIGIYDATSDTNPYPNALIVDSGEFDTSVTTGARTATINQAIAAGTLLWFVMLCGTASPTVRGFVTSSLWNLIGHASTLGDPSPSISVAQAYGALPGTFPAGAAVSTTLPGVWVRLSA